MENAAFSPRDLLSSNKWSSLFFSTYSLSLSFLEAVVLPTVVRSYRSVIVLADLEGYRSSLADAGAIGVGRSYDLVPLRVPGGVFHPKVMVVADEEGTVRASVGSGNLTFGGWGYNTEVLDVLIPGPDSNCFADLAEFLRAILDNYSPNAGKRIEAERIPDLDHLIEVCRRASRTPGSGNSRLLHTISEPLDTQLRIISEDLGGAASLTIVSPFFSGHSAVTELAAILACERIFVAVPPVAPSIFDFEGCRKAGISVSPVASDRFNDTRSLHAKLFDIECRRGRVIVSGSANATKPAISGKNVEAVTVRIVDRASSLGWRPSGTHEGQVTGEQPPKEASGPCIVANFDGQSVVGRIFGLPDPKGEWIATLSSGTRRESVGSIIVDDDNKFRFGPPEGMDPISLPSSAQVILERGGVETRGWLVLQELLQAVREKGPIARAVGRVVSGADTTADVCAILEYLAKSPTTLLDAATRQGGARVDKTKDRPVFSGTIPSEHLQPISAFDMHSAWTGGGGSRAFNSLLDALIRHFATSLPSENDDAGDDDDEVEESRTARGGSASRTKRGPRVPIKLAQKAFKSMFLKLEQVAIGPDRIPGLYALFDMIVQIVPRCDDGDALFLEFSNRWMAAAKGCRKGGNGTDPLDKCVALIATKWTMDDLSSAVEAHAALQGWLGSRLSESQKLAMAPVAFGFNERRLSPGAGQGGWSAAWRTMISTETPWAIVSDLVAALRSGGDLSVPAGATSEESEVLHSIASGGVPRDRYVVLKDRGRGRVACPACHLTLPWFQQGRLLDGRIATCDNFQCHRVIINTSL